MIFFDSVKKTVFATVAAASFVATCKLASEVIRTALAYKHHCYDRTNPYGVPSFVTEHDFYIKPIVNSLSSSCANQTATLLAAGAVTVMFAAVVYKSFRAWQNVRVTNKTTTPTFPMSERGKTASTDLKKFLPPDWGQGGPPPKYY